MYVMIFIDLKKAYNRVKKSYKVDDEMGSQTYTIKHYKQIRFTKDIMYEGSSTSVSRMCGVLKDFRVRVHQGFALNLYLFSVAMGYIYKGNTEWGTTMHDVFWKYSFGGKNWEVVRKANEWRLALKGKGLK